MAPAKAEEQLGVVYDRSTEPEWLNQLSVLDAQIVLTGQCPTPKDLRTGRSDRTKASAIRAQTEGQTHFSGCTGLHQLGRSAQYLRMSSATEGGGVLDP